MRQSEKVQNCQLSAKIVCLSKLKNLKLLYLCIFQPEWYLTQVLMWMSNSSTFMEEKIQPILDRAGANISARVCCSIIGCV